MGVIVFRVDASPSIGTGHFVRCATLASTLATRGAEVHFISRELPGHCYERLEARGFRVHCLSPAAGSSVESDAAQTRAALAGVANADWLIVDHYGLDSRWEHEMRPAARRILAIDDLADRAHDCDVLIDQNLQAAPARYSGLLPPACLQLLGPGYALLPPEFATLRAARVARDGKVRRVLVCFGGSDPQNHTAAALHALAPYAGRLERIEVIVGPANPHRDHVADACAALPNATFHCSVLDMAALIRAADLAIGAGGTMNWERACLGVPTLVFGIADNQRLVLESLIEAGCAAGVPDMAVPDATKMSAWLACLIDNPALLRGLGQRSAALVDGHGVERVADALVPTPLDFRRATWEDSENILRWRNDPAVRDVSIDAREIDRESHRAWLQGVLADPRRILLVAERGGEPAGIVRFDLRPPEAAISVYRVPAGDVRGGLVRQATAWLRAHQPGIRRIVADVLPENIASLAAFRAAGYRDARNTLVIELETQ